MSDLIIGVKNNSKPTIEIFRLFYGELNKFLNDYNLKTSIFTSNKMEIEFAKKLSDVYKDTPLIIKKEGEKPFTFTIIESDTGLGSWSSTFRIESRPLSKNYSRSRDNGDSHDLSFREGSK